MRLINVDTFALQEFAGAGTTPPYAILSHTWGDDEVTYQDLQNLELAQTKAGFDKIQFTCLQAKVDGLQYAWADVCCIDKSSSHELSEAINSMYSWYMNAQICYVYLSDVPGNCPPLDQDYSHPSYFRWYEAFEDSRWFTRGWTLQELIAPRTVLFFGGAWNPIGTLTDLMHRVSDITGIQQDVLDNTRPLSDISIAKRLSWAAKRNTTRREDEAYCLLGLLDINLPLLYGEGAKAFTRLQEELIRVSTDQSIFAWDAPYGFVNARELLLAPSPRCFMNCGRVRRRRGVATDSAFRISNKGLEITLPTVRQQLNDASPHVTLGILDCRNDNSTEVLALVMSQHPFNVRGGSHGLDVYVSGYERHTESGRQYARLIAVSPALLSEATPMLLTITRDLQSQSYKHAFDNNAATWFPVRFGGGEPGSLPTLRDVWPEDCWYDTSATLRLHDRQAPVGGVVVEVKDGRFVLITFGLSRTGSASGFTSGSDSGLTADTRMVANLAFVDPHCPLGPHVESLTRYDHRNKRTSATLRLSAHKQLVAQLWQGALTVSVEKASEGSVFLPTSPLLSSPPNSPLVSPRAPSFSAAQRRDSLLQDRPSSSSTSPYMSSRAPSFSSSRQPSLLQDARSERSDSLRADSPPVLHWTKGCAHCQEVRKKEQAERERRKQAQRRRDEDAAADQQKHEKQEKLRSTVKGAGMGLSLGSLAANLADVAEFL